VGERDKDQVDALVGRDPPHEARHARCAVNLARDLAFRAADVDAAHHLVRRLDLLHADRCAQETAGSPAAAVRDARLIHDQVEGATMQQLRAALILATTPELRSIPVVLGRSL
jgi:hypothetical protein